MRISGILAVVAVVAVLAGCGAPTPTPTASPSPSEEPAPLVRAEPVIPLTCDELVPPALVGSIVTTPGVVLDGSGVVDDIREAADRQVGTLSCTWASGSEYSAYISIAVVPEPSLYTEYEGWMAIDRQYVEFRRFGDSSRDYCGYGYCTAHILVGNFFVESFVALESGPSGDSPYGREPLVDTVLASVADAVRRASSSAGDEWEVPDLALRPEPGFCDDSAALDVLSAALALPALYPTGTDTESIATVYRWDHSGEQSCGITPGTGVGFGSWFVLPGGRWAFDDLAAVDAASRVDVDVEGVDGGAVIVRSTSRGPSVTVPVDGSLFVFSWDEFTPDEIVAFVPTVVEAARASAR